MILLGFSREVVPSSVVQEFLCEDALKKGDDFTRYAFDLERCAIISRIWTWFTRKREEIFVCYPP